jgi:hypothetical protein
MSVYRAVIAARDAMDDPTCPLSPGARSLWRDLASRVDVGGECYPSNETIANALCIGANAVRKLRRELEAFGALVLEREAHGRGHLNTYRLVLAAVANTDPQGSVSSRRKPILQDRLPGENRSENRSSGIAHIGEVGEVVKEPSRDHDAAAERARATYAAYADGMRSRGATPLPPQAYWISHSADIPDVWADVAQRA